MKVTIYLPDEKAALYETAKAELSESISSVFIRALEREVELKRAKRTEVGRIVVEIRGLRRTTRKAFTGRWLVEHHEEEYEDGTVTVHAVAPTPKGSVVGLFGDKRGWTRFDIHANLKAFFNAKNAKVAVPEKDRHYPLYPPDLLDAVNQQLEADEIEELDI